jgi:hypothetical protein
MNDTLPIHTRTLPRYLAGVSVGRDIGLRTALEVAKEIDRQRDLAVIANVTIPPGEASFRNADRHEYARARWSDVAGVVADHLRQGVREHLVVGCCDLGRAGARETYAVARGWPALRTCFAGWREVKRTCVSAISAAADSVVMLTMPSGSPHMPTSSESIGKAIRRVAT